MCSQASPAQAACLGSGQGLQASVLVLLPLPVTCVVTLAPESWSSLVVLSSSASLFSPLH